MARKAGEETEIQVSTGQKFEWIQQITNQPRFQRKVRWLCHLAEVSRSGYYTHLSESAICNRQNQQQQDEQVYQILLKAYRYKRRTKGARQIQMTLQLHFGLTYNLKRIRRLMNKFGLVCPVRRANPLRRMAKATQEHRTCPNTLERKFKPGVAGQVLLTDITYLRYGASRRAYLSTIKDAQTNEILDYQVSDSLGLALALDTLKQLKKHRHLTNEAGTIHVAKRKLLGPCPAGILLWPFQRRDGSPSLPNAPTREARDQALHDVLQSGAWAMEPKKAAA